MSDIRGAFREVMGAYLYEVVHADGSPFSIHKDKADAEYWADRIGGRIIDYVPRHDHKRETDDY